MSFLSRVSSRSGQIRLSSMAVRNYTTSDGKITERAFEKGSELPPLSPGTLRFYNMRFCPFAQRTKLLLEHKNIRYETVNIHLKNKPDWLFERNPFGLVPVLEKDGQVIFESLICNDYLEDLFPNPPMRSSDPYQRARDMLLIAQFDKYVVRPFYKLLLTEGEDEGFRNRFQNAIELIDKELSERGNYLGGKTPGLSDFSVWPWFERFGIAKKFNIDLKLDSYPNLHAWMNRMWDLPAVKATMFDTESHFIFISSLLAKQPVYDYGLPLEAKL